MRILDQEYLRSDSYKISYKPNMAFKRSQEYGSGQALKRRRAMTYRTSQKYKLSARINRIMRSEEKKNFDVTSTVTTSAGVATITSLGAIVQGDGATNRDGRKCTILSVQNRYFVNSSDRRWRVIVFVDHQLNGSAPVAGDLLEVPGNAASPLNLSNQKRFTIIHDNWGGDGYQVGFEASGQIGNVYSFFKKMEQDQIYAGASGEAQSGGVFMLTVGTAIVSNAQYSRIRFSDS